MLRRSRSGTGGRRSEPPAGRRTDETRRGTRWRVRSAGTALAVLGAAVAAGTPAHAAIGPATGVVVRSSAGAPGAAAAVADVGGHVVRELGIIGAVSATVPAGSVDRLRHEPGVTEVTADARVRLLGQSASAVAAGTYDPTADFGSMWRTDQVIGAQTLWNAKATGSGIDVALIDSGVSPVEGLTEGQNLIYGPDLSFESQSPNLTDLDTFGHGTHMAGIIAGHDPGLPVALTNNGSSFLGVAPGARIVSVKVADSHGNTDVSQVIAGIDWVVQHAHDTGMNIRVLNLSFGTDSTQDYTLDPLAYAAEVAWKKGIVVVVSAGNDGGTSGRLNDPAVDPFVIAVGADDPHGTPGIMDDTVPAFSSRGNQARTPDLVAPGAHIQGLRDPGSFIDQTFSSTGAINDRFFRGSGTSQAAAVTSGAAALLLSARPTMSPDQVKALMIKAAVKLPAADAEGQGAGLLNLRISTISTPTPSAAKQNSRPSSGTGTLDGARGSATLVMDGVALTGQQDIFGNAFDSTAMANLESSGTAWVDGTWNGGHWSGSAWSGSRWSGAAWTGSSWSGSRWSDVAWDGSRWSGSRWSGAAWTGSRWSGSRWSGSRWSGLSWG